MQCHPWSKTRITLAELSAACQSYRNPELVEDVVLTLVFCNLGWNPIKAVDAMLAEGIKVDELILALSRGPFIELACGGQDDKWKHVGRKVTEILNSEDFTTLPEIDGPVEAVITSYDNGVLTVKLFTRRDILSGDRLPIVRLSPPSSDAKSANPQQHLEKIEPAAKPARTRREDNEIAAKVAAQLMPIKNSALIACLMNRKAQDGTPLMWESKLLTWDTKMNPYRITKEILPLVYKLPKVDPNRKKGGRWREEK